MNTDAFALLEEPRQPWLDPESLKARFLTLTRAQHPDRVQGGSSPEKAAANERFAELNAAYARLRETKDRVLHLYELENGSPPKDIQRIPPGTMDLFVEIGQTCRDCDGHLASRTTTNSPMLRFQTLRAGLEWTERLLDLQQRVNARRDEWLTELKSLNAVWGAAPPIGAPERPGRLPLERLELIYRALSYIARWTEQLQERLVQLAA